MGKPNRAEIVRKLARLFEAQGYTGAGMADISKETGLGRGSLYHLFPAGKTQMMREVLAFAQEEFAKTVVKPLETGDVEGMFAGLGVYFHEGEKQSLWGRLTGDPSGSVFREEVQEHYNTWRGALTKALLGAGVDRGLAASLSERTLSGVEGTLVLAAGFDDAGALSRGLRTMSSEIASAKAKSGKASAQMPAAKAPAAKKAPAKKPSTTTPPAKKPRAGKKTSKAK